MFNLEIDENEILERTLSTEFGLNTFEIENAFINRDKHLLDRFATVAGKYNNFISVIGRVDVHDVIPYAKAIETTYDKPIGLIIIDYLGLMKNKLFKGEYERVSDTIQKLKEVALHLQIPVIDNFPNKQGRCKEQRKRFNSLFSEVKRRGRKLKPDSNNSNKDNR